MKKKLPFSERAHFSKNPTAQRLFRLMSEKETNLAISADLTRQEPLLQLVDAIGSEICLLKTHVDIIEDFDEAFLKKLQELAAKHSFLILEDRKFADIGNTVKQQYQKGLYHIANWADMVTAHSIAGPGVIDGLKAVGLPKERGVLLLAEMSSQGNLMDEHYTRATVVMAKQHADFVIGFIAQRQLVLDDPGFLHVTPGVQLNAKSDAWGQQYNHPERVVVEKGSDVIVVGRGIYEAERPIYAAQHYRELAWRAYCSLI